MHRCNAKSEENLSAWELESNPAQLHPPTNTRGLADLCPKPPLRVHTHVKSAQPKANTIVPLQSGTAQVSEYKPFPYGSLCMLKMSDVVMQKLLEVLPS